MRSRGDDTTKWVGTLHDHYIINIYIYCLLVELRSTWVPNFVKWIENSKLVNHEVN